MRRFTALGGVLVLAAAMLAVAATAAQASPDQAAAANIAAHRELIGGSVGESYVVRRSVVDAGGASHVRFTRTHRGMPVLGGDFVVHQDRKGALTSVTTGLSTPIAVPAKAAIAASAAASRSASYFQGAVAKVGEPTLVVDARSGVGILAWETVVSGLRADGQTPSVLHVVVDAQSGAVRSAADEIKTLGALAVPGGVGALVAGTGNSIYAGSVTIDTTLSGATYSMVDPSHGNGTTCDMNQGTGACTTFTDADNIWGNGTQSNRQSAGVDAHYGAALTYDYFKNVHGRNGIFGNGAGVPSRVHYANAYVNAFWDGSRMTYGDGSGNAKPLVSIDVAGHEMGHGITENIIPGGLTYSGESGGLNESASDIWGNMVEFYAGNANDPGDYKVGEKIDLFGNGTPLRYMYDPKLDGASKNCWYAGIGGIDVHYSSGVGNLAYVFLAEGSGATPYGNAPLCPGANPVTGIGRAKAQAIWYRAMDIYFTSSTQYVTAGTNDSRAATLRAATDLYGLCSTEYKTVQGAWSGVNVAGEDAPCTTPGPKTRHDYNGDGKADLALTGGSGWTTIPVAFSNGNGTFAVTNNGVANFPGWAAVPGVKAVYGDFNGDGKADIALSGGGGWTTIPVAFSNGNGTFNVTNGGVANFPGWATAAGSKLVSGDFNGDGRDDLALTGGAGWTTVPVAFSNGNGTFNVTNNGVANFPGWAAVSGVKAVAGDFNGDGRADIALTGGAGWTTVPVAFSNGNGTFNVTNNGVANFPGWASVSGVKAVAGDFNGDGRADIALTGGAGWTTVPVAFSNGNGTFNVTNAGVANFPVWGATSTAQFTSGDFNGDGRADLALSGVSGWTTVPVAFSNGNGTFGVTNAGVANFPVWAAVANVKLV